MEIVVCVKQVPDTAEVRIDPEKNTLIRDGVPSILNPYDAHALEAALGLRDRLGGVVTVLTMGPPQAEETLRECISMGADKAVLLSDRAFAGADTLATSYTLSQGVRTAGFDLIVCGKQAIDGDTAQVGPEIAELLDIPHVAYVRKIEEATETGLRVQRLMEDGYDVVSCPLPALITVVRELNTPRMPSLKGKMRAKKAEIPVWGPADISADEKKLGLSGSPTRVDRVATPSVGNDRNRRMLDGTLDEQVAELVKALVTERCA